MAHLLTTTTTTTTTTTKALGDAAEDRALAHLQQHGLRLLARRVKTPGRGGGELDLIMQERDGTLVFVEVRARRDAHFGGAWASVDARKRGRLVLAARHFLQHWQPLPPCRFDVVGVALTPSPQAAQIEWLRGAFGGDEG